MPRTIDADVLAAALVGYQSMLTQIDSRITELRQRLGTAPRAARHQISAAGRARIAAAQKKRWAAAKRAAAHQRKRVKNTAVKPAATHKAKRATLAKKRIAKPISQRRKPPTKATSLEIKEQRQEQIQLLATVSQDAAAAQ